jgi:hypothetical protein
MKVAVAGVLLYHSELWRPAYKGVNFFLEKQRSNLVYTFISMGWADDAGDIFGNCSLKSQDQANTRLISRARHIPSPVRSSSLDSIHLHQYVLSLYFSGGLRGNFKMAWSAGSVASHEPSQGCFVFAVSGTFRYHRMCVATSTADQVARRNKLRPASRLPM